MRKGFAGCAGASVSCDPQCPGTLAADGSSWIVAKDPCTRDTTLDPQCAGMGSPAKGYHCEPGKEPTQAGCTSFPIPDAYCCAK